MPVSKIAAGPFILFFDHLSISHSFSSPVAVAEATQLSTCPLDFGAAKEAPRQKKTQGDVSSYKKAHPKFSSGDTT